MTKLTPPYLEDPKPSTATSIVLLFKFSNYNLMPLPKSTVNQQMISFNHMLSSYNTLLSNVLRPQQANKLAFTQPTNPQIAGPMSYSISYPQINHPAEGLNMLQPQQSKTNVRPTRNEASKQQNGQHLNINMTCSADTMSTTKIQVRSAGG